MSSFRSLPALQQRPSLGLRDIAKLNASSAELPAIGASKAASHPRDFGLGSRKRLPRPKDIEIRRPLNSSPIRSDPSSLDLLSTAGLASTSTFTLSKFPFPEPPASKPATPPLNVWPPESNPELTPSLLDTPPATPAVLHFRGTSFDVVNPHNSLYLSNLETPADLENEDNDYFHRTSLDQLLPSDMDPPSRKDHEPAERHQRALYHDLKSAHAGIAKTKFQAPQQPQKQVSHQHDHAEAMLSSVAPVPRSSEKLDRRASIIDRARTVFKRRDAKPTENDEFKAMPYHTTSDAHIAPRMDGSNLSGFNDRVSIELIRPSGDTWETYSEPGAPQYDKASEYANSEFDSNSMYFGPLNNRRSVPFGVQNQITDYSGEVSYQFEDTPRHSTYAHHSAHPSAESRISEYMTKAIDNTIGNIYDQYGGMEGNEATISTEGLVSGDDDDDDDDAATIKVPSLRSMVPTSPHGDRTSGLSKFDFGLDDVRNSGNADSPVTSPVTPQDGTFPKIPAIMRAPAGVPPKSPPPLAPGMSEKLDKAYSYASEDYSNRGTSYGDTRKLLGISGNIDSTNRMSVITEGSRLSEGDRLPPSPLQEFIDRCDSQRGTPEFEQYHQKPSEPSQNSLASVHTDNSMTSEDISIGGIVFPMPIKENLPFDLPEPALRKKAMLTSAERNSAGNDIPAMWMRSASPGPANPRNESPATMATEGTDGDWETLAQTTTAGDHSRENSHGHTPHEKVTVQGVSSMMRSNTNPWRKNKTDDGFDSSPIMTSPIELTNIPRFPRDSQFSFLRNSGTTRDSHHVPATPSKSADSQPFQLSPQQMSNFVANGPSDEILVEEYEMSPLSHKPKYRDLQMLSSRTHAPDRVNSFDKLAVVGPRANLTGTPMGTGMRHAGSSTVGDSSSPPSNIRAYNDIFASSPPDVSTPARQSLLGRSDKTVVYSPTAGGMVNPGHYMSPRTPSTYNASSPLAQGSTVSSQSSRIPMMGSYGKQIEGLRADASNRAERYRRIKAASVASSSRTTMPRTNGLTMPRASVRGMTSPFPLELRNKELRHQDSLTFSSERSEPAHVIRPDSCHTVEPLYRHSPHLIRVSRPNSSNIEENRGRKKKLSWIIFAMCFWFPPTAILLFLGILDGMIFHMSGREIYHVGQLQKKCALVAFILEIVSLITVLVLWLSHVF